MKSKRKILFGQVGHERLSPKKNKFIYNIFAMSLPLSNLETETSLLFSINRWNLISLWFDDYGQRDGDSPIFWVKKILDSNGLKNINGEIILQTLPRVLGYAFNPISFWFCYDSEHVLRAVICEVNNTFGESHSYLVAHPNGDPIKHNDCLKAKKLLFVSPFFEVVGSYQFHFAVCSNKCDISINYFSENEVQLKTFLSGNYEELNRRNLCKVLILYPLCTFGVIFKIHWQAVILWIKGIRFLKKPPPPDKDVST